MRKLAFVLLFFVPIVVFPQIYTSADLPSPADTVRISEALTTAGVSFLDTGLNQTWDFSGLTPFNQRLDTFLSVSSLSFIYQAVFNNPLNQTTLSNLAGKINTQGMPAGQGATEGYNFFRKTTAEFRQTGTGFSTDAADIPIGYDTPDIIYKLPLTPSSPADSSVSGYEINIPGMGYIKQIKNRKNIVDGSGTLITPFGTFTDVIRLRSEIEQWDSISMDTSTAFPAISSNIIEYKWLKSGFPLPLLQISVSQFGTSVDYIDIYRGINWYGEENIPNPQSSLNVYPNPAENDISIEIPESFKNSVFQIRIYSTGGQMVFLKNSSGEDKSILNLKNLNLAAGVYYISIINEQKQLTEKIIIR